MMQGITALPGAQQGPQTQQPQAPGQSMPFQAMPAAQPQTPQAMTGQLQNLPPQQLLQMFANPADKTPKWAVVTAYAKAIEQQRLMDAARGQSAMQQSQMQGQQPPVAAQVMSQPVGIAQGFSGGGAVAFQSGAGPLGLPFSNDVGILPVSSDLNPGETREEYIERKRREAEESRVMGMSGLERLLRRFSPESKLRRALYPDTAPPVASGTENYSHETRVGLRSKPVPPAAAVAAAPLPAPAPTQPRANRPGTGVATAAPTTAPATPTAPPVDRYGEIEAEGIAGIKALQDLLRKQGETDPELARLRQAAYESAQGIASRRERERAAALEAAQKATTSPLLQNQEALLRMAASLGGAKRFGEGLSRAAGAAGEVRGEQRKALEAAQKVSREEQNAIDQLNQALAEKRVADRSGDVNRQQEANVKVAEAQLKVTDLRKGLQTQRGVEADREEQRKIAREQIAAQLQAARIGAAARTEGAADPRKVYDTIIDNVQKEYDQWAKTVDGVRATPEQKAAKRNELLQQQIRIASAAGVKGLEGLLAAGAPAPTAATRVVDFSSIK